MRIAMLSPIAWSTPPEHYGPWERVVSLLTEGLIDEGVDVTLFATGNSHTKAKLCSVIHSGYEEDKSIDVKVWEGLHISEVFDRSSEFDIIHNHFDFLPLTYSGLVKTPVITTIHGFSSSRILPVFEKYNGKVHYISISNSDRAPSLDYLSTIYHGIDIENFSFIDKPGEYLLFFGRIHPDKGAKEAIKIAKELGMQLIMAGVIHDNAYYEKEIKPEIDGKNVIYQGSVGPKKRDHLLGNAYALLHPISFDEPFGLSIIESMACGTPVVAFNRGSMPELIRHGKNGFLVSDVEQAIESLKNIPDIDRNYCRTYIEENFTKEHMAKNYIKAYNQIIEKSNPKDRNE